MTWSLEGSHGFEAYKIMWELVPYTNGVGLDIGCGPAKAFPHFIGVDNRKDTELFGIQMDPDLTIPDACKLDILADESMDFVFSSHLLEHITEYKSALREWWRLIKVGGHLCLYLPHAELYPKIGEHGANPDHKHDFLPSNIVSAMTDIGSWDLVRDETRSQDDEYSFFQVYKKLPKGTPRMYSCHLPRPKLKAAVIRYGGFGDGIQAASIFPGLKRQGYHITLYTSEACADILKHDPNLDEVIIQGQNQVPNSALGAFWKSERKKYDKWVNLSQSVEINLLTMPGMPEHTWPKSYKDKYMNTNYVQATHEIADVPYIKPEFKFYPSEEESKWVERQLKELGEGPIIMWSLAGSSVHKVWPHMDAVVARIVLTFPSARVIFVGGKECEILEDPWRKESKVWCKAGKWRIRETLAMAEKCDLLIGGETGVLNAVATSPMPKILFLSHSSHENLTRDWENTFALYSRKTPCYPCHQLHYSFDYCPRGKEFEVSQCQEDIPPDACWVALLEALEKWRPKLGQKLIVNG